MTEIRSWYRAQAVANTSFWRWYGGTGVEPGPCRCSSGSSRVTSANRASSTYSCDSCVVMPWNIAKNGVSPDGRLHQCAVGEQSSKAVPGTGTWKSVNTLLVA